MRLVGLASGFGSVIFVSAWSRLLASFSANARVTDVWPLCSLLVCIIIAGFYFGPRMTRVTYKLRVLAVMLVGAGISSIIALHLLPRVGTVTHAVNSAGVASPLGLTAVGGVLTFAILFVPCFLLGGIVSFATGLITPSQASADSALGWLYCLIFSGSAAGVVGSAFVLVPSLGYRWTLTIGATIVAATGFAGLILKDRPQYGLPEEADSLILDTRSTKLGPAAFAYLVFIAATMVSAILWARILLQVTGQSVYTHATVLALYLAGMAIGGGLSTHLIARTRRHSILMVSLLSITGICWLAKLHFTDDLPFLLLKTFGSGPATWTGILLSNLAVCLPVMLVPGILMGLSLPLATATVRNVALQGERPVGAAISAACMGSLIALALTCVLPAGGLTFRAILIGAAWVCTGCGLYFASTETRSSPARVVVPLIGVAVAVAVSAGLPRWNKAVMTGGFFTRPLDFSVMENLKDALLGIDIVTYEEDPDAIVAVARTPDGMALRVSGRIEASTGEDVVAQILTGHIPMVLHGGPKRVLLIGLASGVTLGSVETHTVEEIVCVEPVPALTRAARFFAYDNRDALGDGRVKLVTADPTAYLLRDHTFDVVIVQCPSVHSSRTGQVLAAETVELIRSRLATGGVVCQRLRLIDLTTEAFKSAAAGFAREFPHTSLWWAGPGDVLLIGSMQSLRIDMGSLAERVSNPEIGGDLSRIGIVNEIGILGCYTMGRRALMEFAGRVPPSTLDRPLIEYDVPKAPFQGDPTELLRQIDSAKENPVAVISGMDEAAPAFAPLSEGLENLMRARTLYVGSVALARAGRFDEVVASLEAIGALSIQNRIHLLRLSDYYVNISKSLAGDGRFEDAIAAAGKALEANPNSYRGLYNAATLELGRRPAVAIALLARAIEINPGYVPAYLLKAETELSSGQIEAASNTISRALSLEPFNIKAQYLRALVFIEMEMLFEARGLLEGVLKAQPENIEAMDALAYISTVEGDLDEAQGIYERILEQEPNHLGALNNYATVLAEKGDYKTAVRVWTKALALDPGNRNLIENIREAGEKMRVR